MNAWMRILSVTLTSDYHDGMMVFGVNQTLKPDDYDFNIKVKCHKYMSTLKDDCTIEISNLSYSTVMEIIQNQYYNVQIDAGYGDFHTTVFKGGVVYISNTLNDRHTHTVIILCASQLVAKFSQRRINLKLNSGINMFSAIDELCKKAGIKNYHITNEFASTFVNSITNEVDTAANILNKWCERNPQYIINADSIDDNVFSVYDIVNTNIKPTVLDITNASLVGGFPRLTSSGLSLTILPTFSFKCGDIIKFDNSLIDVSASSAREANTLPGNYLDTNGEYLIFEQAYTLTNEDSEFSLNLSCRSYNLLRNAMKLEIG